LAVQVVAEDLTPRGREDVVLELVEPEDRLHRPRRVQQLYNRFPLDPTVRFEGVDMPGIFSRLNLQNVDEGFVLLEGQPQQVRPLRIFLQVHPAPGLLAVEADKEVAGVL